MKRNFPDWLAAYRTYASDGFTPEQFNMWSGLSVISGALERKVWIPWSDTFSYYPNIFVLLVSLPGAGKSTALNKAVGLMQEMNQREGRLNLIPSQVTEAKFIELMGNSVPFEIGTKTHFQSSGYYFASEASNSLKNVFGDFIACLTDFYDCPPFWEKATKKDDKITLRNVCLNLLAGSTFDYLGKLVTDDNIMGGFASRIIYVLHREKLIRKQKFASGGPNPGSELAREAYRRSLIQDLEQIHKMAGPFTANKEFGEAWEAWYPEFEEKRQSHPSEKMQSLLVRTNTNVLKASMLFSAARSNDRQLTIEDWDNALSAIEPIEKEIPSIFREAKASDTTSQDGLNQFIFKEFVTKPTQSVPALRNKLLFAGFSAQMIEHTFKSFLTNGAFQSVGGDSAGLIVKLMANPDHYV